MDWAGDQNKPRLLGLAHLFSSRLTLFINAFGMPAVE